MSLNNGRTERRTKISMQWRTQKFLRGVGVQFPSKMGDLGSLSVKIWDCVAFFAFLRKRVIFDMWNFKQCDVNGIKPHIKRLCGVFFNWRMDAGLIYTVSQKSPTLSRFITSLKINRFSEFCNRRISWTISNKVVIKYPTTH